MGRAASIFERTGLDLVVGTPFALRERRREERLLRTPLRRALEVVAERCGTELAPAEEAPLFIFSAGWRSGSTLLQRLVNSSGAYVLWGEPYARSEIVTRLADSLRPVTAAWPMPDDVAALGERWDPADRWTANLHPPLPTLVESHRALLRTLFGSEAKADALEWGFKEVRLDAEYGLYLRFLFPRAKLLFLVRDPFDAYASYKSWRSWYRRWPDQQVRTAAAYARMWRQLAGSFAALGDEAGAELVRYEDLVPGNPALHRLEAVLGAPVDRSVLERRISGSSGASPLNAAERLAIRRGVGSVGRRLGY